MNKLVVSMVVLFLMSGCTKITILDEDGVVSIHREFGFVALNVNPEANVIVSQATVFGYMSSPLGISLGYGNHSIASLSDTCRVVLWVETKQQVEYFKSLLGENDSICPVTTQIREE